MFCVLLLTGLLLEGMKLDILGVDCRVFSEDEDDGCVLVCEVLGTNSGASVLIRTARWC